MEKTCSQLFLICNTNDPLTVATKKKKENGFSNRGEKAVKLFPLCLLVYW